MTSYTSGFILTSDQVKQLATDLSLAFQTHERAAFAALAVRNHLERVDPFLERFGVCAVELWEQPALERTGEPAVRWMIPTARYNDNRAVDPNVHGNTVKIKAAVVATGVPEGYLSVFGTFPDEEYRHASVKVD